MLVSSLEARVGKSLYPKTYRMKCVWYLIVRGIYLYYAIISKSNNLYTFFGIILLLFKFSLVLFKFSHKSLVKLNLLSYGMWHKIQFLFDHGLRHWDPVLSLYGLFYNNFNKKKSTITITVDHIRRKSLKMYFEYSWTASPFRILYCHWL